MINSGSVAVGVAGALLGFIVYRSWKRVQREEGNRLGYVSSKPISVFAMSVGFAAGIFCSAALGIHSYTQLAHRDVLLWSPIALEIVVVVAKNHFLSLFIRRASTNVPPPSLAKHIATLWDRFKYTLFVMNICMTGYFAGAFPEKMYLLYTIKVALLLPIRIYEFRKQKMQLYNYELCLFVNYALLIYLYLPNELFTTVFGVIFESKEALFRAIFGLANGPVAWYIVFFSGSLSLYDRGKTTSAMLHFAPPLVTYCIRHFTSSFPQPPDATGIFTSAMTFYALWAAFEFVILGVFFEEIKSQQLSCVFMESAFDPVRRLSHSHTANCIAYFAIHGAVATFSCALSPIFYTNPQIHWAFIFGLAFFAIWNGSIETFERFKEAYDDELKSRLRIADPEEQATVNTAIVERLTSFVVDIIGKDKVSAADIDCCASLTNLGLDSMRVGLLGSRIQDEFKVSELEAAELINKSIIAIARIVDERAGKGSTKIVPCPRWFSVSYGRKSIVSPVGATLAEQFLNCCDRFGSAGAIADDTKSGGNCLDYTKMKIGSLLVARFIASQLDWHSQQRIGVMLPASVGATVVTFGALIAGKTPVMLNFTVGEEKLRYCAKDSGITATITSKKFTSTLASRGITIPDEVSRGFVFAEDIMDAFTTLDKIVMALGFARRKPHVILKEFNNKHTASSHAVVLFTSGSTANPKGVPLTHRNLIEDVRSVVARAEFVSSDIIMAALPPFHSFGFAATTVVPVTFGIRCVFYPNPTAFYEIGRQMGRWKPTMYLSTPSWMAKVYSAAKPEWTSSLRVVVVGAEHCPESVKKVAKERGARIIEGYGITETSPAIATTKLNIPSSGVGWAIDGVRIIIAKLIDEEAARNVDWGSMTPLLKRQLDERDVLRQKLNKLAKQDKDASNMEMKLLQCRLARPLVHLVVTKGMAEADGKPALGNILVSGPIVFGDPNGEAYLNHPVYEADPASGKFKFDPYVEFDGAIWYNSEDLGFLDSAVVDENGVPATCIGGRMKRFLKRGGEMISLGSVEEALATAFPELDGKRTYACESWDKKDPDGTVTSLFAVLVLKDAVKNIAEAQQRVRKGLMEKFSGPALNLHLPDGVFLVHAIPMLGTGKLDLQGCKAAVEAWFLSRAKP